MKKLIFALCMGAVGCSSPKKDCEAQLKIETDNHKRIEQRLIDDYNNLLLENQQLTLENDSLKGIKHTGARIIFIKTH